MKTEWIISMSVPYCVVAMAADQGSIIAKTRSGAIYLISRSVQDRITGSEYDNRLAEGIYRAMENSRIMSIDEIREELELLQGGVGC